MQAFARISIAILAGILLGPAPGARDAMAESSRSSDPDVRVHRVEEGLLPAVLVQGEALPRMTLRDRMDHWKVPGVSIAVIDAGAVAWTRVHGRIAALGTDSISTGTLFQAGSVSKPIATMTALHLVEEDRVRLDEDVNRSLRSWRIPATDSLREIAVTLRMLLTHSAGLTVHGFPGYANCDSLPSLIQILDGVPPANTPPIRVTSRPGVEFRYSGGGFCVVQQLLMDITGEPYAETVERIVLQPLGMIHSTFDQPAAPVAGVDHAAGHDRQGVMLPSRWHCYPELAAAGLWSTPNDLARLVLEIQGTIHGTSGRVISRDMTRSMLEPQITPAQGIGWRLAGRGDSLRFEHSGDTAGFACGVVGYAERGQGAVVMTNGAGGTELVPEIMRAIAAEYGWPGYLPEPRRVVEIPAGVLSRLAGRYVLDGAPGVTVEISVSHDSLFATVTQPSGTERGHLLAESPTRFFDRESGVVINFGRDAHEGSGNMVIQQGDEEYTASRVR